MLFRRHVFAAVVLVLAATVVVGAASAARGGGPSTPTNLRITATTDYSISLAWDASRGSGDWWYCVQRPPAGCIRVNPPQTSITITNLMPDTTFTYVVYAINSRGQRSGNSNSVTYTTPPDVTPPAPAPQLSQTYLRPTRIGVSWTGSTDNTSQVWHTLYLNGDPLPQFTDWIGLRSATLFNLTPGTTYEFQVVARDRYFNLAPSNVVSVTTPSTTDTTPPTAPTNLVGAELDNEIHMSWTQSTDDTDPQNEILYEFYLNGVTHPDDVLFGSSGLVYCRFASGFTTVVAKAVDTSGNRSGPSNQITVQCP
jgi:chitodextrinase